MRSIQDILTSTGRPLWALRCTREEYDALLRELKRMPTREPRYAKLLVLVAAETIRREYRGGPWKWEVVRARLGSSLPSHQEDVLVETGLAAWDRPVRTSRDGAHLRLSSLICEGGIATHLLTTDGGTIRGWCDGILRDLREAGYRGDESDDELADVAARRSRVYSASYLKDRGVHILFGRLVGALWNLHVTHGEFPASDVTGWLDTRDPRWRGRLPLDLEDAVAQKLLVDLLGEVERVAHPPARPVVRSWLESGQVTREVVLPSMLQRAVLADLFGARDEWPRRMQLTIVREGRRERLGQLERSGSGEGWRCVAAARTVAGAYEVRIELEGGFGRALSATGLGGAAAFPDALPWVFARDRDRWRLVGFGSVRHVAGLLRVAVPDGTQVAGARVGSASERPLFEVRGDTSITIEGETFRIRPGEISNDDGGGDLALDGRLFPWPRDNEAVFLGPPVVWRVSTEGTRRRVPDEELRVSEGTGWMPWPPRGGGRARVRWVVRGETRGERSFTWLPAKFQLRSTDVGPNGGLVEVADKSARLAASRMLGFDARPERDALRLRAREGMQVPARADLRVLLANGREVHVQYPFPCERDAFFDREGKVVTNAAMHELVGLRAEARGGRARPAINLRIIQGNRREDRTRLFPPAVDGLHSLDLRELRDDIQELFSTTDDLDANVQLEITHLGGPVRAPVRMEVARYARRLVPNKGDGTVGLDDNLPFEAAVDVRACRFVAPEHFVPLTRLRPGWRWVFDRSEPGTWLLVAKDAFAPIARPVAWSVPGTDGAEGRLAAAMRLAREAERCSAIRTTLVEVADGVGSEADLTLLEQSVGLLEHAEASALDVVRIAATVPKLAARLALFALDEDALGRLWGGLESLPFLWETVPLDAWRAALDALFEEYGGASRREKALARVASAADRVHARFDAFDIVYQPWRVAHGADTTRPDPVGAARWRPDYFQDPLRELARQLLGRHTTETEEWPTLPHPSSTHLGHFFPKLALPAPDRHAPQHCWPVQQAPAAAAAAALTGMMPDGEQVRFLRYLRAFDREWFEDAYSVILTLLSARQPVVYR